MFGKAPRGATQRPKKSANQALLPKWLGVFFLLLSTICVAIVLMLWRPWQPVATHQNDDPAAAARPATQETNRDYQFYDLLPKQKVTPIPEQAVPKAQSSETAIIVESRPAAEDDSNANAADESPADPFTDQPAEEKPVAPVYMLQVRSFEDPEEADARRAEIILNGLSADVIISNEKGKIWYRVVSGPYASVDAARTAQQSLQNAGIDSIIVKQRD